jgi:hypothetical protein
LLTVPGRIFAAATSVLLGLLALAPGVSASAVPVAGGSTVISMNRGLHQLLKLEGVRMSRLTPATVQGRFATFPVALGGTLDPTTGRGSVGLEGGIELRAGGRRIALTGLELDTSRHVLSGRIGGRLLPIASTLRIEDSRDGFGANVGIRALRLKRTAAKVLNRKLSLDRVFRGGRSFAEASSSTQPASVTVAGGSAVLAGDEGTFGKLKSLDVEVTPFESATVLAAAPPTFGFPLLPSGATVPLDLSSGGVGSDTGLRLIRASGATTAEVSLVGLSVSLESKTVSADTSIQTPSTGPRRFGVTPIATLDTAGASTSADPATRTVALAGAGAKIDQFLAERLDDAFAEPKGKTPPFSAGEPLGALTIAVQAP